MLLASRAIDRDNELVTNTYVVNENFDVYYVISGTIKESEPEIDDEKVSGIIASVMMGTKDEIEGINELKTELHIEENISSIDDLMMVFYDPIEREQFCMYFKTVDRIYILEVSEIDEELIIEAEYASKESNQLLYQYASKLGDIHTELEIAFLKLEAKFPFLLFPDTDKIKIWKSWYPEANKFIKLNKNITKRNRMLQQWAAKDLWLLVKGYNILFNKLIMLR